MAGRAYSQPLTLKDQGILHADTHFLPDETIPKSFATGSSSGWPEAMMLRSTSNILHSRNVTSTSQCIQLAMNMTEAEFDDFCEGVGDWPCWAMFRRYMERDEIRREFHERWAKWDIKQYRTNNGILGGLASNDMRRVTIAKNKKQIRDIEDRIAQASADRGRDAQTTRPRLPSPPTGPIRRNPTQNNDNKDAAIGFVIVAVICWFLVSYFGS